MIKGGNTYILLSPYSSLESNDRRSVIASNSNSLSVSILDLITAAFASRTYILILFYIPYFPP